MCITFSIEKIDICLPSIKLYFHTLLISFFSLLYLIQKYPSSNALLLILRFGQVTYARKPMFHIIEHKIDLSGQHLVTPPPLNCRIIEKIHFYFNNKILQNKCANGVLLNPLSINFIVEHSSDQLWHIELALNQW